MTKEEKCTRVGTLIDKIEYALKDLYNVDDDIEELLGAGNPITDRIADAFFDLEESASLLRELLEEQ